MAATDLVDRLAAHKTLGAAPSEELAWLAAHGVLRRLNDGDLMVTAGALVDGLFILLTGHVDIFVDRGAGRHKVMDWRAGDVTGVLPYSRLVNSPGDSVAQEPTEILVVHRDHLPALIRDCHQVTSILVHTMLDRARVFTSSGLHDEKMVSLGKLSAGLAHELNNPVSAIERSAALLMERLADADLATRTLGAVAADRCPARGHRQSAGRVPRHARARRAVADPAGRPRERHRRLARGPRAQRDHGRAAGRNRRHASMRWTRLPRRFKDRRSTRCSGGRPPAVRCARSRRRSRTRRRGSPVWSWPSRGSRTWTRPRWPSLWTWRRAWATPSPCSSRRRARGPWPWRCSVEPGLPRVAGLRRRTESDLGQSDRQRAGRRSRRRPRRGDGAP